MHLTAVFIFVLPVAPMKTHLWAVCYACRDSEEIKLMLTPLYPYLCIMDIQAPSWDPETVDEHLMQHLELNDQRSLQASMTDSLMHALYTIY